MKDLIILIIILIIILFLISYGVIISVGKITGFEDIGNVKIPFKQFCEMYMNEPRRYKLKVFNVLVKTEVYSNHDYCANIVFNYIDTFRYIAWKRNNTVNTLNKIIQTDRKNKGEY